MAKSTYQKIKEENQELEHQFRIYGGAGKNDAIELLQPGRTARGKLSATSATTIKLEKKNIWETAEGHKLELVNKDGEYETAIWTTTPENIKKALRSGLFEAADIPNPLAKMIAQIGEYKRQVYEKFIKEGSYSQNHQQKEFIADSTQDCLASLNSLHASINNYNEGLSPERNFQLLLDKVRNLIKEIESMENKAAGEGEPYKTFREGLKELKTDTAEYENKLLLFRVEKGKISREDLVDNILRPYGVSLLGENISIQCFLQKQINQINSFSVGANNMITGAWPTLMGRDALGQSLLEARFTGEKFSNTEIDYHNPLTAAHALDFSGMENEKGLITLDTEKFGFKPKSKLDLLKGLDQLQAIDTQENILLRSKEKIKVGLENWGPFRIGLNGLKDIGGFLCDLGYGLGYAGYAGIQKLRGKPIKKSKFPSSDWEEFHKKEAGEEKIFQSAHSKDLLKKINENTALTEPSFIEKMYGKIYGLGKMLISDPLELVFVETIEMATKAGSDLWQDLAGEPPLSSKKINSILNQCLQLDEAEEKASQAEKESLIQAYNSLSGRSQKFVEKEQREKINQYKNTGTIEQACVPYHLTPDDPCDTFSWATNDFLKEIVEVFSHEIYRAHPLAGLAFTAAASTAAPMMFPGLAQNIVLNFINSNISLPIAHTFIGSETVGFMPAFSTALLQGKMAYLLVDAANGEDSFLARGLKAAVENPVMACTVLSVAVGFGYAIAFKMNIPGLSAKVADETQGASVPYVELGLTGAKIAAILVENTVNLQHHDHTPLAHLSIDDLIAQHHQQLLKDLEVGYKRQKGVQTLQASDYAAIESMYLQYCDEFKLNFKNHELGNKVQVLENKLKKELGEGAAFRENLSALSKPLDPEEKEREDLVNKILKLNPSKLTHKIKRQLMDYVEVNFKDDQQYIAAVKEKLHPEKKRGPIFNSLKTMLWYTGQILTLRPLVSGIQWGVYERRLSKAKEACKQHPENKELLKTREDLEALALLARGRCTHFFSRVANDVGRLVKGVGSVLRKSWDLAGSILHNIAENFFLLVPKWRTGKIRSRMSAKFFAPGSLSRGIDAAVGGLRASATAKNLSLASRDLLIRERLKNQVASLGSRLKQTSPIAVSGHDVSEKRQKVKHSSTCMMLEAELAQGHGWLATASKEGLRYRTFPKNMQPQEIDKEIRNIWKAPASIKTSAVSDSMPNLLPNQTRAKEFSYQSDRAIVIEALNDKRDEVVSKIIFSNKPNSRMIYDQLQSGIEEYQRHQAYKAGEYITITINSRDPLEVQKLYLLACVKLGCCCCDDRGREIYSPDFKADKLLVLGKSRQSLEEFSEQHADFLNADFETEKPVRSRAASSTVNDPEYSDPSSQSYSTQDEEEGEEMDSELDRRDNNSSPNTFH